MDGLGGYADAEHGTELEEAVTPNLDRLAADGSAGLVEPVGPGITPGSGPGHLGLFGYDPEQFELGRGALSAAGLDFELRAGRRRRPRQPRHARRPTARSPTGAPGASPTPRRRPSSSGSRRRCTCPASRCSSGTSASTGCSSCCAAPVSTPDSATPTRSTPACRRSPPSALDPRPSAPPTWSSSSTRRSAPCSPTSRRPTSCCCAVSTRTASCPSFEERYGLRSAAVAIYPMYRGIARLLGMDVLGRPADLAEQLAIMRDAWNDYDYFFLHHKYTDSAGEDGDRARKIAAIETLDAVVPELRALGPDVIVVSGDHSTPSQMAAHSWHPVPTLLWSERLRARRRRAVRRALVPPRHARHPPHQGPHGPHARQRRPPRQVRRLQRPRTRRRASGASRGARQERASASRVSRLAASDELTRA